MNQPTPSQQHDPSRLECNLLLIKQLEATAKQNPDWRFQQILQNIDITPLVNVDARTVDFVKVVPDLFYEESKDTVSRVLFDEKIADEFDTQQNNKNKNTNTSEQ